MRKSYILLKKEDRKDEYGATLADSSVKPLLHRFRDEEKAFEGSSMAKEGKVRDKFRGCLLGALIGDCIGTLFECDYTVTYSVLGDLYVSLTNLSEDEKLMDFHGIDFTLEPRVAQDLLERKKSIIGPPILIESNEEEENSKAIEPNKAARRHSSFERRRGSFSRPIERYSDDSVMTRSIVKSIMRMKGFDVRDVAIQLTEDYFMNMTRKFSGFTRDIFVQLRKNGYTDIFGPSKKASGNIGSLGNEGATRVAPLALFAWNSDPAIAVDMACKLTKLTNYHKSAVLGAAIQVLGIHTALNWGKITGSSGDTTGLQWRKGKLSPSPKAKRKMSNQENIPMQANLEEKQFDHREFCRLISEGISSMENKVSSLFENIKSFVSPSGRDALEAYMVKIQTIVEFLDRPTQPSRAEVVEKLGNGVKAIDSVPTALYSFLLSASSNQLDEIPVNITSPVLKSIFYAISLGGDSDTTASMAGALAGAYWGYDNTTIPQEIVRVCEGSRDLLKITDNYYSFCCNNFPT